MRILGVNWDIGVLMVLSGLGVGIFECGSVCGSLFL